MKEIVDRLQEKRQIELATNILESSGYSVSKKSKRLKESANISRLESEIKSAVRETMTSSSFGFPEDEIDDYTVVEVGKDKEGYTKVEVRAEVSYEGLEELCNALNPIVEKYDKKSYFEPVTSGIIAAYLDI